jgi:hypothetical protein
MREVAQLVEHNLAPRNKKKTNLGKEHPTKSRKRTIRIK